jgi:general secretion pathway protein I
VVDRRSFSSVILTKVRIHSALRFEAFHPTGLHARRWSAEWIPDQVRDDGSKRGRRSAENGFTSSSRSAQQGFTLLEMLVALAVFSLAALALVRLQGVTLRTAADLDSKALGQIVARNLMVEVQSDVAPPSVGEEDGEVENGGRRWHWTRTVKATEDKRLLQVDLVVDGQPGASPVVLSFLREVE